MAFCASCGNQLEDNARFCVKCGADQITPDRGAQTAGGAPSAAATAAPEQRLAATPQQDPPPAQHPFPIGFAPAMPMPPAPAKRSGWIWALVIGGAILFGLYYHDTHSKQTAGQTPPPVGPPAPQAQPNQPAVPGQPGVPGGQQPVPQAQPGNSGSNVPYATLLHDQEFAGGSRKSGAYVQVINARWTNHASIPVQSAVVECDHLDGNGRTLSRPLGTLNGPVQPGRTATFNPFDMGQAEPSLKRVNCFIEAVTPAQ